MQRLLATLLGLMVANAAIGQADFYNGNGQTFNATTPIDAPNFFNAGDFFAPSGGMYNTYNTVNYTNRGRISGGHLRFETVPSGTGLARPAANFINESTSALVSGSRIEVNATNIFNRGSLSVSAKGRITLQGDKVDLSFSRLTNAVPPGILDNYWGIGSMGRGGFYSVFNASSPIHEVERVFPGSGYFTGLNSISVFQPLIFTQSDPVHANTTDVQVVFFKPPSDTNIVAEVKFFGKQVGVQWSNALQHAESSIITTNVLYFVDRLAAMNLNTEPLIVMPRATGVPNPYPTYIPTNYNLTTSFFWGIDPPAVDQSTNEVPPIFPPINEVNSMRYTSWAATLRGNTVEPNGTSSPGASITNAAGRIEVVANESLDLSRSRITAENYLLLRATNHFVGSARSFLSSPYYDLDLASTNRVLNLDGLLPDDLGRFNGQIRAWTGFWSYVEERDDEDDHTFRYHILIIDSTNLRAASPALVHDFKGRAPEIVLGDVFNLQQSLSLDCESLTVTSNGQLNILSQAIVWSESLPNLRNFTNFGSISANSLILSRDSTPNVPLGTPYDWIVNHGRISASGILAHANNLIHSGSMSAFSGDINLRFGTASIASDMFAQLYSGSGDVSLVGNSLYLTNSWISARDKIVVNVSGEISDGGTSGNNFWNSADGISLLTKPSTGDLLGTRIWCVAEHFNEVEVRWAGANGGGYQNNAAVGELTLEGKWSSLFRFRSAQSGQALYVDRLILSEDMEADLEWAIAIDPDFTLYYQTLWTLKELEPGLYDVSLSSINDGDLETLFNGRIKRFVHTPTPTAEVNLRNSQGDIIGTITVSSSLRDSDSIDSDGDGIVNSLDAFPFDGPVISTSVLETGAVRLNWNAAADTTYSVWSSDNLSSWVKVTDIISGPVAGPIGIDVPASTNVRTFKVSYSPQ